MAIEGLEKFHLKLGPPRIINKTDSVGATVEALSRLKLLNDRERVTESVAADYESIKHSGHNSEVYPWLPRYICSLPEIIKEINYGFFPGSRNYMPHEPVWELWENNTRSNINPSKSSVDPAYKNETLKWKPHLRSVIYNQLNPAEPMLHFLNLPFDDTHVVDGHATQQKALISAKRKYEATHPGYSMVPISGEDMAMIILIRQIMGLPRPLGSGIMRDGTRRRTELESGQNLVAIIGCKVLENRDYYFMVADTDDGEAKPNIGVGLSVGNPA